jgi:hypothetical protein
VDIAGINCCISAGSQRSATRYGRRAIQRLFRINRQLFRINWLISISRITWLISISRLTWLINISKPAGAVRASSAAFERGAGH